MQRGIFSYRRLCTLSCVEVSFNLPKVINNVTLMPDCKSLDIQRSNSEYFVTIPRIDMHCALVFHY